VKPSGRHNTKTLRTIEQLIAKRAAAADSEANDKIAKDRRRAHQRQGRETPHRKKSPRSVRSSISARSRRSASRSAASRRDGRDVGALFGLGLWMPLGVIGLMSRSRVVDGHRVAEAPKAQPRPAPRRERLAVNAQAKLNVPFGASLTKLASIPSDASRSSRIRSRRRTAVGLLRGDRPLPRRHRCELVHGEARSVPSDARAPRERHRP